MANQELSPRGKQELTREEQTRPGRTYVPEVDIYETPDSLWLWADMPGVDEQSLEINVDNGMQNFFAAPINLFKNLISVFPSTWMQSNAK